MSLDIVVLGTDGRPERELQIGVNQHYRLMQAARELELPLLERISDYYGDAEYKDEELLSLEAEIEKLFAHCVGDDELLQILSDLQNLVSYAREDKRGIEAIAD
jgi:hypothetical protein